MLLIIILLLLTTIVSIWILGRLQSNILFIFILSGFLCMLFLLLTYFVKIGGTLPQHTTLLFGAKSILLCVARLPVGLEQIGNLENILRFGITGMFFINAIIKNFFSKQIYLRYPILFVVTLLPLLINAYISSPYFMYNVVAYNYDMQNLIVFISFCIIFIYFVTSFSLYFYEYRQIILTWYKHRHLNYIIAMIFFSITFLVFAQFDPVVIYQDYNRVQVLLTPIILVGNSQISIWLAVFSLCVVMCAFMVYQNCKYFVYEYDRSKLEMTIKQKVTAAEITTSMLLHGLKNQLLVAQILNKKIEEKIHEKDVDIKTLQSLSEKALAIHEDMSDKLSYMHRTMTDVNTVLVKTSSADLFEIIKKKTEKKDSENIVFFKIAKASLLVDRELFSEAVYNIISNALDAVCTKRNKRVVVRLFFSRVNTIISVADNGEGMENGIKKRIFMPFTSTKNTNTNWGLGLCYARRIIKKHMGEVRFESTLNQGTTFFISLPRYLNEGNYER